MALDGMSLDQLRTFISAAEEGSFSAAGRKLHRAQSVVSQTLANLESQLGVKLFDRDGRYPRLTEQGQALLNDAKLVADGMDELKARAKTLREGLEPELSLSIDVMYPMCVLTEAVGSFRDAFPHTPLRLYVEVLGAVIEPVLKGTAHIGVIGTLPLVPKHVQLVLTDRSTLSQGQNYGVFSQNAWKLADMGAKHAFLRAGFGFGHMPRLMVEDDIASEKLRVIRIEMPAGTSLVMPMQAVYRKDAPPGPAGRWLIQSLKQRASLDSFVQAQATKRTQSARSP